MTKELEKKSAAARKTMSSAFSSVPGNLFQRVGAALWDEFVHKLFLCVCSLEPQMVSRLWEED